jgi:ABC-type Fe3+-hydroxamate transport system substrate-binding protein
VILSIDEAAADPRAPWLRWRQLAAVRNDAIYALPADTVARASPRLVAGVQAVCEALEDARRQRTPGTPGT